MDKILPPNFERSFKQADIRGVHVIEIDDDVAYLVARAFVDRGGYTKVAVGYDMRLSSPSLVEAFMRGVEDAGADVLLIGLVTTPMLYFVSGSEQIAGVMITASHSPAQYNGLKLVEPGAVPLTDATGLKDILRRIKQGKFNEPEKQGKRKARVITKAFQKHVLSGINVKSLRGLKLAADVGNGMASVLIPLLEEKLPIEFTTIFADMDPRFPNRGSDPTLIKNQKALRALLQSGGFDFGISFDGDADRIAFLDETGAYINAAVVGALISEHLLKQHPGGAIAYTTLTGKILPEAVRAAGGKAVPAKVGHAFVKRTMAKYGALFGAEQSGHFFFKAFYTTDSVVYTLRYMLEIYVAAKAEGKRLSELVAPYQKYIQLEDEAITVPDQKAGLAAVKVYLMATFPEAKVTTFDGLMIQFPDAWGVVKASVTEPTLKVMFEAPKKRTAKRYQDQVVAFIRTKVAKK